jgi:hypothetical protein
MKILIDTLIILGAVIGSALVASTTEYSKYGFIFYLISSLLSVRLLFVSNVYRSILVVNAWFVLMNCVGVYRGFW